MKPFPLLILAAASLLFASCSTSDPKKSMPGGMRFSEYTGADSLEWETSAGSLADTSYDLPVYRGWPSRPYKVIGEIHHVDAGKDWREGEIKDAVEGAAKLRADALIIRLTSEVGVGAITGTLGAGVARGRSAYRAETTALVIRWQTEAEIQSRMARDEKLRKQLLLEKPDLDINNDTAALAIKYLLQSGAFESSSDFFDKYKQIMLRVSPAPNCGLSGDWVYKAVVTEKGLVDKNEDQAVGLASVKLDGDALSIVSTAGKTEVSFSGQLTKGRLTGQVSVGALSSKAEGVALDTKISLSCRAQTPDGVVQAVLVLQRNQASALPPTKTTTKDL